MNDNSKAMWPLLTIAKSCTTFICIMLSWKESPGMCVKLLII